MLDSRSLDGEGADAAGDTRPQAGWLARRALFGFVLRGEVADQAAMEEVLAASALDRTVVKEGRNMKYRGSCHCGAVAFDVEGEIQSVMACNCSMCRRKGSLLWFVPRDRLTLLTPEDAARVHEFNRHVIKHRFCPTCGIHPYADGIGPQGQALAAVNVRCLDSVDLEAIPVTHFDGRSL